MATDAGKKLFHTIVVVGAALGGCEYEAVRGEALPNAGAPQTGATVPAGNAGSTAPAGNAGGSGSAGTGGIDFDNPTPAGTGSSGAMVAPPDDGSDEDAGIWFPTVLR